ncbi:hypothetical protein D9M68_999590 [compost metagenome]
MEEVWQHPQLQARNRWREVGSPEGNLPALLPPGGWSMDEPRMDPVPALGEHTGKILQSLGCTDADIATLRQGGAI